MASFLARPTAPETRNISSKDIGTQIIPSIEYLLTANFIADKILNFSTGK